MTTQSALSDHNFASRLAASSVFPQMMRLAALDFALESAISAQLVLFAGFLLSSRRRAPALYLLAALSCALAVMILANLLAASAGWLWTADFVLFLDLGSPPIVFLYVREIRQPEVRMRPADLIHALPQMVGIVAWKADLLPSMDLYVIGCWALYLTVATLTFARNQGGYGPANLRRFIVVMLATFWVVTTLRVVMAFQASAGGSFRDGVAFVLVLAATFIATCQILFTALRHPGLLTLPGSHVKYAQSSPTAADSTAIFDRFESLMRERRPHRNPDLTLGDVSALLGVPVRQVSQLVNTRFGVNFPAFLNQLRVREAALLLTEVRDKPIKVVMFESGFRSKSIFNREFQRCFGRSPSDVRRTGGGTALATTVKANQYSRFFASTGPDRPHES
jgi:AraC-like DNA-binding protein